MSKLLFFAIIVVLIFWMLKKVFQKDIVDRNISSSNNEDMVCCSYCSLHLPRGESITKNSKFFCSEEHARLYSL